MAYRDDHGHFVSKQEDGRKCTHDFETGFRSVFEERGIKVKPKENWKTTRMASGIIHEMGDKRIIEEENEKGDTQYRIGGTNGKVFSSLEEAKNADTDEKKLDDKYNEGLSIIKEEGFKDDGLSSSHRLLLSYAKGEISEEELVNGFREKQKAKKAVDKEKYQSILKKAFNALDKQDAMDIIFSNTEVHKAFQKVQRENPNDSFWYQLSLLPDKLYGDK